MRMLSSVLVAATLLPTAAAAQASSQASLPQTPALAPTAAVRIGEVDFGVRVNAVSGDPARYQRFRDLRDGLTIDRLRYDRDTERWMFRAVMDHAGYRDQRYSALFNRYGKLKASFEWNQVPLLYGRETRTPFRRESEGVFRLDDTLQAAIQSGAATRAALVADARAFDLRSRRDVADLRFTYAATRRLDLKASFTSTARSGTQPWGASFGFGNPIELPAPVEHRTNDVNATAEWSNGRSMARVAYDASWFNNSVETLIWDNPLRLTDQTHALAFSTGDASSQGRMALWPDSTAHTVSATGSLALPARSRALAYVSIGS